MELKPPDLTPNDPAASAEPRAVLATRGDAPKHADTGKRGAPDDDPANADRSQGRARAFARGFFGNLQRMGADMLSVALGKLIEPSAAEKAPSAETDKTANGEPRPPQAAARRVGVLHAVTERLRGAADTFVAAKLDEIEARVDAKLDQVEERIDAKLIAIHKQLGELRDREIRHRLRLLKITLIFTVLVAALSLGYKWLVYLISR